MCCQAMTSSFCALVPYIKEAANFIKRINFRDGMHGCGEIVGQHDPYLQ